MMKEELASTLLLDKQDANADDIEPITLLSDEPTILAPEEQQHKEKLGRDAEREDLAACEAVHQRREKGGRLAAWEKQFRRIGDNSRKENACPKANVNSISPKMAYTPTKFGSPSKIPKATVATLHSPRPTSPRVQVVRSSPRTAASPYKTQVYSGPTASPHTGYRTVSPRGVSTCHPLTVPRRGPSSNPATPKQSTRQVVRPGPSKATSHKASGLIAKLEKVEEVVRLRNKSGMDVMPGSHALLEELEQMKAQLMSSIDLE